MKILEKMKFRRKDDAEIATKTIMNNSDIFADFLFRNLSKCVATSVFPSSLKTVNMIVVKKKRFEKLRIQLKICKYSFEYLKICKTLHCITHGFLIAKLISFEDVP